MYNSVVLQGLKYCNLRVYYNGEIISNIYEGVTFDCECPFSFTIQCTMSFLELQNGFCENIQSHISKRVSNISLEILYNYLFQIISITDDACMQQMFYIYQQTRFHVPMIELYVEFEQHMRMDAVEEVNVDELGDIYWEEDNNDSEEKFEANYEVDDENDDGDLTGSPAVQNEAHATVSQLPFGVPSFMRTLDLEAMHVSEFPEYVNMGEDNVAAEDGEFSVGMEFGSRESKIQWQTHVHHGAISQDHAKLDSDTITDTIRLLVEADPSIKVKSIIAEVQSRFNYAVTRDWPDGFMPVCHP
ncbi:hypothetical protein Ahy_B10g104341 [Arachis hypogaea]|uniref:Transposase MuDR plant domain-containing protein n=1 Tax=Arachis hypogaea TaxID=3818 RepID=A0A444X586_ARAHY|nr:hypothetical protein Ahy_B10g104341 [Arachis hypogaea]